MRDRIASANAALSPSEATGSQIVLQLAKNGHADLVASCLGVTGAPFDAYLTLRGVRTLFARVERQQETAGRIAERLTDHPAVKAVHHPGLASHSGHTLAKQQQRGFGAMLSFELAGLDAVRAFVDGLKVFTLADSSGGWRVWSPTRRYEPCGDEAGGTEDGGNLGRAAAAVGRFEAADDLISDLRPAFDTALKSDPAVVA